TIRSSESRFCFSCSSQFMRWCFVRASTVALNYNAPPSLHRAPSSPPAYRFFYGSAFYAREDILVTLRAGLVCTSSDRAFTKSCLALQNTPGGGHSRFLLQDSRTRMFGSTEEFAG